MATTKSRAKVGAVARTSKCSDFVRDPDRRAALVDLLKQPLTIDAIRDQLIARFGADRVPSRSAVHRLIQTGRKGLSIDVAEWWKLG